MIVNLQGETLLLILRSFLSGIFLGILYDVFTVALKMPQINAGKVKKAVVSILLFIFDFTFCLVCAAAALLLMYYSNRGFYRSLVFIVMFLGFLCFRCSLGILFRRLLVLLYRFILKLFRIALIPLCFIKSKMILLYRLTIGKIIGKIVSGARAAKEKRLQARAEKEQAANQGPEEITENKEDFVYVGKGARYRKNGRIKF